MECVRERMKQKLQSAMRTLRKSINKQQFYIQFSGTEYEVAQKPSRVLEGADACSTGQVLREGKCGKFGLKLLVGVRVSLPCHDEKHRQEPLTSVSLVSELWDGDILQRGAGAVRTMSPRDLPGYGGSVVL